MAKHNIDTKTSDCHVHNMAESIAPYKWKAMHLAMLFVLAVLLVLTVLAVLAALAVLDVRLPEPKRSSARWR